MWIPRVARTSHAGWRRPSGSASSSGTATPGGIISHKASAWAAGSVPSYLLRALAGAYRNLAGGAYMPLFGMYAILWHQAGISLLAPNGPEHTPFAGFERAFFRYWVSLDGEAALRRQLAT